MEFDRTKPPYKPSENPAEPSKEEPKEIPMLRMFSLEELKHILEEHQKWIKSNGKEGETANLENGYLEGDIFLRTNFGMLDLEKAKLAGANLKGAILPDVKLEEANLQKADLREAKLWFAHLQQANLQEANLQKAQIWNADIRKANIVGANLQQANLAEAKLQGAAFNHATLREANFQNADLTGATGLLTNQFAGANVSGAKLPDSIAKFEGLGQVKEISQRAQKLFVSILLGCVYCWLTIATTMDVALITNSGSTPLPIIQTKIPLAGFYWAAPLLLLSLYAWFHLYLQRMWEELAKLPAVFPDGKTLDEKVYPWLVSGLVRTHVRLLKEHPPALSGLQTRISIFLAWWVVPLTFIFFWLRYLPKHHWAGTIEHIILIVVTSLFAAWSQALAKKTLRGQERPALDFANDWKTKNLWTGLGQRSWRLMVLGLGTLLLTVVVSDGAINGVSPRWWYFWAKQEQPVEEEKKSESDQDGILYQVRTWYQAHIPVFLSSVPLLHVSAFANFKGQEVSTRPPNWFLMRESDAENIANIVKGAHLGGEDLRGVMGEQAFLMKADLRHTNLQEASLAGANLQEADFVHANLQEADLAGANLQMADLSHANLQKAFLEDAILQKASLADANLQGANLRNANLQEVDLHHANLQEASLLSANLQGANLAGANLQEVDLRHANLQEVDLRHVNLQEANLTDANLLKANLFNANLQQAIFVNVILLEGNPFGVKPLETIGLEVSQIRGARNWVLAIYGDTLRSELLLPPDHNVRVKKQDLGGYNLAGYNLQNASLSGWNLKGANLQHSQLQRASLTGSKGLTQSQLNEACVDKHTKLPKDLTRPKPCSWKEIGEK